MSLVLVSRIYLSEKYSIEYLQCLAQSLEIDSENANKKILSREVSWSFDSLKFSGNFSLKIVQVVLCGSISMI